MVCDDRFTRIHQRARRLGISDHQLTRCDALKKVRPAWLERSGAWFPAVPAAALVPGARWRRVIGALILVVVVLWVSRKTYRVLWRVSRHERCRVRLPDLVVDTCRPPVSCAMCTGLADVDRREQLSPEEFAARYAYSGRPLVVTDVAANWSATKHFSFDFFRRVYRDEDGGAALERVIDQCQFFRYRTEFRHLGQALAMSEDRRRQPWYFGWSNCDSSSANLLRRHYSKPYFLPADSESSKTDWIFIGTPGYGAHMHIDAVGRASWQAQIRGQKQWTLEPPPECYWWCPARLEVTVQPGEAIVLDTNIWYHKTLVVGDEVSVVIGSEYD